MSRSRLPTISVIVAAAAVVLSSCASSSQSGISAQNVYERLATGGIYCSSERVDQPMSYVERDDGTTESASPYPWTMAVCDTGVYAFSVRMYGSGRELEEALSGCLLGEGQGFVSRGGNWIGYAGGLDPLDRREADAISTALGGKTVAIPDLCSVSGSPNPQSTAPPVDRQRVVEELMAEIGDEGLPEGAKDCIKQGLSGLSTEELTALRDGGTGSDVPVELQDKVIEMMTNCVTE